MKLIFTIIIALGLLTRNTDVFALETVAKKDLPYEIQEIRFDGEFLTIKGWAFLHETQHFLSKDDHSYKLVLKSVNDQIEVGDENFNKFNASQTNLMYYTTSGKYCSLTNYNKKSTTCNYKYENVGFSVKIPLGELITREDYRVYLKVIANNSKKEGIVDIYFPISTPIVKEIGLYQYSATSNLIDTELRVIDESYLRVRTGPGTNFKQARLGDSCSSVHQNYLFHKLNTVYKTVYEEKLNGLNTWYRVSGKISGCLSGRRRIVNGNSIKGIWIASNFVEYQGKPLVISKVPINDPNKLIRFVNKDAITNQLKNKKIWQNNRWKVIEETLRSQHVISDINYHDYFR